MSLQNKTVANLSKHGTYSTVSLNFPITAAYLLSASRYMQKHYAEGLYSNNFLAEQYHVDAAYRRSSMVCLSVTIVSPAKAAKLIEMPLGCGLGWAQGSMC